VILNEKDFFYTNKSKGITLWLGMDMDECLALAGAIDENDILHDYEDCDGDEDCYEGDCYDEYYYHYANVTLVIDAKTDKLARIYPDKSDNWESYKGINSKSTEEEIVEILGRPTHQEIDPIVGYKMSFIFYNTDDGCYKKAQNMQELEIEYDMLDDIQINETKQFIFYEEETGFQMSLSF